MLSQYLGLFDMFATAKTRDFPAFIEEDSSRDLPPLNIENEKWSLKLNITQLVIVWSVIAGVIIGVFLLGFYAGREQGLKLSLEKNALDSVRLPINETDIKEVPQGGFTLEFAPKLTEEKQNLANATLIQKEIVVPESEQNLSKNEVSPINTNNVVSAEVSELTKLLPGWYVQVAASRTKEDTKQIISKLKDQNYNNIVLEKAESGKRTYFRVLAGPYSEKNTAELIKKELSFSKIVKSEPYIKNVK